MQNPAKSMTDISLLHSVSSLFSISFSGPLSTPSLSLSFIILHSQCTFLSREGTALLIWKQVSGTSNSPVLPMALENRCQVQFPPYASIPIFCKMGITIVPSSQGDCAAELISTGSVLWDPGKKILSKCSVLFWIIINVSITFLFSFFSQIILCFFIFLPYLSLHFFLLLSFLALLLCLLYLMDQAEMLCDWISFCHQFFTGEEYPEFLNAMLHWKQQGPRHLKLGTTSESSSLKLLHPFGPMDVA